MNRKITIFIFFLTATLLFLNIVQYKNYRHKIEVDDNNFHTCISYLYKDIENMGYNSTSTNDLLFDLGKVSTTYITSSYNNKNNEVMMAVGTLYRYLNTNEHIEKKELIKLVPYLKRINKNALDVDAASSFDKLVVEIDLKK